MFHFELKPEMRKELKDPDRFVKGQESLYWGILIAMGSVVMMLFLMFKDPEKVLHPVWLMFLGLGLCAWGEFQKYRAR